MTRGERLNNPLNIRISNNAWKGKITPSSDADFEQFDTPENGIRAGAKIVLTYFHEGLSTIRQVITRWAPPSENPTEAYIENVSLRSGFDADAHLMFTSIDDLWPVIHGMIDQENGECIYTDEQIKDACAAAIGV
jgi:hypothetical protein